MCCSAPPVGMLRLRFRQSGARSTRREEAGGSGAGEAHRPRSRSVLRRAVVSALRPSARARSSSPDVAQAIANRACQVRWGVANAKVREHAQTPILPTRLH